MNKLIRLSAILLAFSASVLLGACSSTGSDNVQVSGSVSYGVYGGYGYPHYGYGYGYRDVDVDIDRPDRPDRPDSRPDRPSTQPVNNRSSASMGRPSSRQMSRPRGGGRRR